VNKSRYEWDKENYEDKEKEMGALCFTRIMVIRLSLGSKNTRGIKGNSNSKLAATPHRCSTVLVKQATRRFHRKLGQVRKSVHKKFSLNIYATSINRGS
jgi:hypothetical protein